MFVEFADVVELTGNLPNQQLAVECVEWASLVVTMVIGFVKVWLFKPRFLGQNSPVVRTPASFS